jgi:hypothetical protein
MYTKTMKSFLMALVLLAMIVGCKDFIEPSLEKSKVILMAPVDGYESDQYAMGFWWEPVTDALQYRIQIVTPTFAAAGKLISDSLVVGKNRFKITLDPGKYEWRVRAENGSSQSAFSTGSFIIHESAIENQKVVLSTPGNNYLTNQASVQLNWDVLFAADRYRLQIDTDNFTDENKMVYNDLMTAHSYLFEFPKNAAFKWRVRAENAKGQSKWSDVYSVAYDNVAPGKVSIVAPANGLSVSKPVALSWTAVTTAKKYKLYVFKSDKTSAYTKDFPMLVNGTSYSFNLGEAGEKIYWRVSALDEAGNEGPLSEEMNFTIQ